MVFRSARFVAALPLLISLSCTSTEQESPPGALPPTPAEQVQAANPTVAPPAVAPATPPAPPQGARVFFIEPEDGAEITGKLEEGKVTVPVRMGSEGIAVAPAGQQQAGSGHHHIIVDGQHVSIGDIVPKDETHLHYGQAQTETTLKLAPGEHTLTMQFADGAHVSYGTQLSTSIKVKVVGSDKAPAKPNN